MSLVIIKKYVTENKKICYACELIHDNGVDNMKTLFTNKKETKIVRDICEHSVNALLYRNYEDELIQKLCITRLGQKEPVEFYMEKKVYDSCEEIFFNFKNMTRSEACKLHNTLLYSI